MKEFERGLDTLLAAAIAILAAFMMAGCRTTREVYVPMHQETVSHQRDTLVMRDSVYVHDSIMVSLRGDTVTVEKFNILYRDRWRDRVRIDSFIQHDTITMVREVEKPPSRWQQAKMQLGSIFLWMLLASAAFFVIRFMYKRG